LYEEYIGGEYEDVFFDIVSLSLSLIEIEEYMN